MICKGFKFCDRCLEVKIIPKLRSLNTSKSDSRAMASGFSSSLNLNLALPVIKTTIIRTSSGDDESKTLF